MFTDREDHAGVLFSSVDVDGTIAAAFLA